MKLRLLSILCFAASAFVIAQNTSGISFVIKNLGLNVNGHFSDFYMTADFSADGNLLDLTGKIKVASIRTGIERRDAHLLTSEYFDVDTHNFIQLETIEIHKMSLTRYLVSAKLTIKGKSKTLNFPVTVLKLANRYKVTSNFEIDRKAFNVGGSSLIMSKTVKINAIHFEDL